MRRSARRIFLFLQIGLLVLLIAQILLERPSLEMLIVSSLALLAGIAGAVGKTIDVTHKQNLTLILESPSRPQIRLSEIEAAQSLPRGTLVGATETAPAAAEDRRRTRSVTLRRKPDTDMIRAIDDAIESASVEAGPEPEGAEKAGP